jgi:cation transport regulator ChaB
MPVKALKKLPQKARRIWEATFTEAKKKFGAERASKIAWSAVKKLYKQKGDNWVKRSTDFITSSNKLLVRSEIGDISNDYFLDGCVATTYPNDYDNVVLTKELLDGIVENFRENKFNPKADIEHIESRLQRGFKVEIPETDKDILKTMDMEVKPFGDGNYGLHVKGMLDRTVENFEKIWYKLNNGFYDSFSVEIYPDKSKKQLKQIPGGDYKEYWYGGNLHKFTITGRPIDRKASIRNVRKV